MLACSSTPPERPASSQQTYTPSYRPDNTASSPAPGSEYVAFNPATANASDVPQWLEQAINADPVVAAELRLRAGEVLLREGHAGQADSAIQPLTLPELFPDHALRLALIQARILQTYSKFSEALDSLANPLLNNYLLNAPPHLQIQFSQIRANLFAIEGNLLAAVRERIFLHPLLNPAQAEGNREQIWQMLLKIPTQVLLNNITSISDQDYLGWIELALIAKTNAGNIDAQIAGRDQWLNRWAGHPAGTAGSLPGSLHQLDELALNRAQQVALLLPVTGRLARFGKAIRDGYLAANFESQASEHSTPLVRVYDTGSGEIKQLYRQALADGADLLIGPLSKSNLTDLISEHSNRMPRPTIALNRLENQEFPLGLYQLSLSPEDEAEQLAEIARGKALQRALILYPEGSWGEKVADTFSERWQSLGGYVVGQTSFNAKANDYSKKIKKLLQLDISEAPLQRLKAIIGRSPHFEPHRRSDADFIFLVARPQEGRAAVPLFAYHYASYLPLYSTSHIYQGTTDPVRDRDINNVQFIDIPWVFNSQSELRRHILEDLPGSEALQRMYALGIDSFRLNLRLRQLEIPGNKIFGETGTLSLNAENQIQRRLNPAQIISGKAVLKDASSTTALPGQE